MSKSRNLILAIAACALAATAPAAVAATVADPAGDFLATYAGPQNGDLDILQAQAVLSATDLTLSMVLNGAVGATPGAFVAFGVDRGAGTPGLFQSTAPMIGAHALHDSVVLLRPDLTGTVVLVGAGGALTFASLGPGAITVAGDTIVGVVPLSLLPSNGFALEAYRYTGWTRSAPGSNAFVADFAPDGSTFRAAVPEPSAWAIMILGFGAAGALLRRRTRRAPSLA